VLGKRREKEGGRQEEEEWGRGLKMGGKGRKKG
jgi:hypothetical protein